MDVLGSGIRLTAPVIRSGTDTPEASVAEELNRRAIGLGPS